MDFKKYPKYKPSGIEWIGEIPEEWEIKKIKHVAKTLAGGTPSTSNQDYWDGDIPWLNSGKVQNNIIYFEDIDRYITQIGLENSATKMIKANSVLVALTGATCANIGFLTFPSTANQSVVAIENNPILIPKFLFYFLLSQREQILFERTGGAQSGINEGDVKNIILNLPSSYEQTAIANFLNDKTSKIDTLIEKKKKLIELLKEERTAVINQAVTRGIDPNVKLKDSGIDWLGQIPEHWEVKKLRYLGNCQNGVSKGSEYFGSGFPFMSYGVVYNNEEISSILNDLAKSSERDRVVYSVNEGDIFFTRTSETIEEIGIASTCMKTIIDATFSGFLIRVRINKDILYKGFSKYYFRCQKHRNFFVKEMNIVTRASLSQDLLKNLPVLLPPFNEQIQIFEFLEAETTRIDNTIQKIEKEIALLKEYRTALISEVVTGKIKVC